MLKRITRVPDLESSKASLWMMLSALIGQFVNFLALPILIGLFGAAAFGQYSLVISCVGTAVVLVSMQLEQAIPTFKIDEKARDLVRSIVRVGFVVALAAGIGVFGLLASGYALQEFSGHSFFAACVVAAIIFSELAFVLTRSWCVRIASFETIAWVQFMRPILFVLLTVGIGMFWIDAQQESGSLYLVFATMISGAIAVLFMSQAISKNQNDNVLRFQRSWSARDIITQYSGISNIAAAHILHHIGIQLPLWVVALNFTSAEVAWVAIALRVTMFPVALSNNSVASVLNNRISTKLAHDQPIAHVVRSAILMSSIVGLMGFGLLYALVSWDLLSYLGSAWTEAGATIKVFCLFACAQFVFSVVRFVPIANDQHRPFLNWNILRIGALIAGALYCTAVKANYETTIVMFAIIEALATVIFLLPLLSLKDDHQSSH